MKRELFIAEIEKNEELISMIKSEASNLHDIVCNQKYDSFPYSKHLCMVAEVAIEYGHTVCINEKDVIPIIFAAYFHDSIEDARVTYNDVMKIAKKYMDAEQAKIATEIVYALTDEKGRTRDERGSDKHYKDIQDTLYAPFVKWCDRYANTKYSIENKSRMANVYRREMIRFIIKLGGNKYIGDELCKLIINLGNDIEIGTNI